MDDKGAARNKSPPAEDRGEQAIDDVGLDLEMEGLIVQHQRQRAEHDDITPVIIAMIGTCRVTIQDGFIAALTAAMNATVAPKRMDIWRWPTKNTRSGPSSVAELEKGWWLGLVLSSDT